MNLTVNSFPDNERNFTTSFLSNSSRTSNNNIINELTGVELFQLYYTPILVYLGTIGNGLSVFVFFRTKLRKLSSSYYLAALAVSDTVFLLSLFVVWLNMIEVDLFNQHGICQLMVYLTGVCSFLSVWLVLAFTVERFVAVRYPLLRQSVCTVSRAKMVIAVLVILAMTFFSPLLMFARVLPTQQRPYKICTVDPRWQRYANVFNVVDTIATFIIPVVVITILNTCISRTIWKLASVRRKLTYRGPPPSHFSVKRKEFIRDVRPKSNPVSQNKVTKMLLVVSTACLCLNLPSYIMRVLTYLIELQMLDGINIRLFLTVQHFCLQLFNTNFGINFVLYCISGQNFRKAIRSLFCRKRRLRRNGTAAFTVSESRTQSSGSSISKKRKMPLTEGQELTTLHIYN